MMIDKVRDLKRNVCVYVCVCVSGYKDKSLCCAGVRVTEFTCACVWVRVCANVCGCVRVITGMRV